MILQGARRPSVTLHYAQTLDGRIATRTGQSQWIGGEASLCLAHRLRATHGAVLVGVGTVLADNPRLTVRLVQGPSPLRVVVDSTLRLPLDAHILAEGAAGTTIATTDRATEERIATVRRRGATVLIVDRDGEGRVDLAALLMALGRQGISSALIEGGGALITSALRGHLVDRLVVCLASKVLGSGIEAVGDLGISHLGEALTFDESTITRLGEDIIFDGQLAERWRRASGEPGGGTKQDSQDTQDERPLLEAQPAYPVYPVPVPLYPRRPVAVWFPGPRRVELREEESQGVGPGEVRIRAAASALSHGTEMLVYRGQVPADLKLDLPTLEGSFSFPIKYGYASVGRVVEVGAEVDGLKEGDLVFTLHPHQTEYVVASSLPVRLPPGVGPEAGLFVANLETAVNVMLDAGLRLGERVLIFGQGTVGLLLTQLARRAGAGLVMAVDPLTLRRSRALEVGADVALSPDASLADEVRRLTQGLGADLVLEASGNGEALGQAIDCVGFQGTVVVCSWYGAKPVTLPLGGAFHRGRVRLVSSQVSSLDPALQPRWSRTRRLALVLELLPHLQLTPLITHRIPFERASEAYDLVDNHPEESVQVVLTYQP